MARSFPNSTDYLLYSGGAMPSPSAMSLTFWVKNPSVNDFWTYVRFDSSLTQVNGSTTGTSRIVFDRGFSTTGGEWYLDSASHGMTLANWNHYAWTHDGSSTANNALFYANGVSKTVTRGTAPVGTVTTSNGNMWIGRWESASRQIGGSMARVCLHNVVLTPGEIQESMLYGWTPRGLVAYAPIYGVDSTEPELSGNKRNFTVNNTTATADPPVFPSMFPDWEEDGRAFNVLPAAAGGTVGARLLLGVGV